MVSRNNPEKFGGEKPDGVPAPHYLYNEFGFCETHASCCKSVGPGALVMAVGECGRDGDT